MSTTLIDWLYFDTPGGTTRQGSLVLFPRMFNRWNIVSLIVSKWEDYKIVIVTDHPNEFMDTLRDTSAIRDERVEEKISSKADVVYSGGSSFARFTKQSSFDQSSKIKYTEWTDLELIPFPLLTYSNLADINRGLQNTEIDVIIFDDLRMLATIAPALDLISVKPKILILTTWGDTYQQLETVISKLPNLELLTFDLISDIANINWRVSRVPMSERQLKYYDQVRHRELTENHNIPYPMTRMLTLYAYPDKIMANTLIHKTICETDQSSIPDKLVESSWLNTSYLDSISEDGPKLLSVLDGIISNWPLKQLIITRFNHRYGVDLITSFLQLMTTNHKNPYEINEIFHASCTDNYEVAINTFHKFNDSPSGILITNIVPLIPLKGISIIHIVDGYSFLNLKMVLDRIHKRSLNTSDLIINVHITTHSWEKSADEALYENLIGNIKESDRIYNGLTGYRIAFDPQLGLIVK